MPQLTMMAQEEFSYCQHAMSYARCSSFVFAMPAAAYVYVYAQ